MHDFQFVNAKMYIILFVYKSNVQKWTNGKFMKCGLNGESEKNSFKKQLDPV